MVIRQSNFLKFFVDITGVPKRNRSGSYEDVTISSVSVNTYKLEEIFNELEHRFPGCAKKKGHNLQATQLMDIIEFLNAHDIRMTTVTFEKDDWKYYRKEYPNESNIEEKIMGILYFYTIKRVAWKNYEYQVLVDNDTSFNIKQSILICQRLARMHDYHFNVTFGYLDLNQELIFPDWVASARRKIHPSTLNNHRHFTILKNDLPKYCLLRVFKHVTLQ